MIIEISDQADPLVRDYTQLTDVALRRVREPAEGLYLAESPKVIQRALAAGHQPRSVLLTQQWLPQVQELLQQANCPPIPLFLGPPQLLESITGFHLHRGAIAAMHRPQLPLAEELLQGKSRIAVLVDITDHTNVGAMFRSAAGLGVDAVLVSSQCADPLYRRSVRVSMGTVFQVPWARLPDGLAGVQLIRQAGFTLAAMALADQAMSLDDLAANPPEKLAVMMGSEGYGIPESTLQLADLLVQIPMFGGVDSLNVAAAAAVTFWALRNQVSSS